MKKLRPTRIRDFIMYFTYLEKIAIIYVASAVAVADCDFSKEESFFRSKIAVFFNLNNDDMPAVGNLEIEEACDIIANMSTEKKRFVAAIMTYMKDVDGYSGSNEFAIISYISILARLPFVDQDEAYNVFKRLGLIGGKLSLLWGSLKYGG